MPTFEFRGGVREDGSWYTDVGVPDGTTVVHSDVSRVLALALEHFTRAPSQRVPTLAEMASLNAKAAASRLPSGWEATLDAVNVAVTLDGKAPRFTRNYKRGEEVILAPCAADGSSLPETREVLLALDAPSTPEA